MFSVTSPNTDGLSVAEKLLVQTFLRQAETAEWYYKEP